MRVFKKIIKFKVLRIYNKPPQFKHQKKKYIKIKKKFNRPSI